jgi:Protein of unknown function (DUF3237)
MTDQLPQPRLSLVHRVEASLGEPLDLGDRTRGRRRIVPLAAGTLSGPELHCRLLARGSADWQLVLPDGTSLADIRSTLQSYDGTLIYVRSRGVRHGPPEVLARIGAGEEVDPAEYTYRTATRIGTAATELDWLKEGVFVTVGAREPAGVIYETYLVA